MNTKSLNVRKKKYVEGNFVIIQKLGFSLKCDSSRKVRENMALQIKKNQLDSLKKNKFLFVKLRSKH